MSVWFREDAAEQLLEDAVQIAAHFLDRTGQVDDTVETGEFLANKIQFMISQGQRNRLLLANRAIAAFRRYQESRIIERSRGLTTTRR